MPDHRKGNKVDVRAQPVKPAQKADPTLEPPVGNPASKIQRMSRIRHCNRSVPLAEKVSHRLIDKLDAV